MMSVFHRALAAALVTVTISATGHAQPATFGPPVRTPAEIASFVDAYMREGMARDQVAGAVVAIVQNGETVLERGYGFADIAQNRPADPEQTLFRIGSISKALTWIGVLQLAEQGKIDLAADINLHLPPESRVDTSGFGGAVRMADLMAHAGGFDDDESYLFAVDQGSIRSLGDYLARRKEPLVRAPGTVSSYSNYGAALAGFAASRAAGATDFPGFIEQALLVPAGMRSTTFREPYAPRADLPAPMAASLQGRVAQGYAWNGEALKPQPTEYITAGAPAGSGYSTAADMARFMRLILAGGALEGQTIYGPQTAQKLQTPVLVGPGAVDGWRHGFLSLRYDAKTPVIGHNGATLFFRSNMILIPSRGIGIFIAANSDTADSLTEALPYRLFEQMTVRSQAALPVAVARRDLSDYAGTYRVSRRAHSGMARFIRLFQTEVTISAPKDGDLIVHAGEPRRYKDQGTERFHAEAPKSHGEESLLFRRDPSGRVIAAIPSHNALAFERAPLWETTGFLFLTLSLFGGLIIGLAISLFVRAGGAGTAWQKRLRSGLLVSAGLLAGGVLTFLIWVTKTEDAFYLITHWPGVWLTATRGLWIAGFAAAMACLSGAAWMHLRAPRDGWNRLQRYFYSLGAAIAAGFASTLLAWGALGL